MSISPEPEPDPTSPPNLEVMPARVLDDAVGIVGALMAPLGYDQIEGLIADSIIGSRRFTELAAARGLDLEVAPSRSGGSLSVADRIGHAGEVGPSAIAVEP